MVCSRCGMDQPREWFGPSAEMWPDRRQCSPCSTFLSQRKRHGLTQAERVEIAAEQGGCAICHRPEPGKKGWVVDHDRSCCPGDKSCPKCRRGVLCQWCNSMLGYALDNPASLLAAVAYLDAPRTCGWHMPVACAPGLCGRLMHGQDGQDGLTKNPHSADINRADPNAREVQAESSGK